MSSWHKDLDALVEQTLAVVESVKGEPIQARPTVEPVLAAVERVLKIEPQPPKTAFGPFTWPASQREEIETRVASFKAHQQRIQNEREDFFVRTMVQTRAMIDKASSMPEGSVTLPAAPNRAIDASVIPTENRFADSIGSAMAKLRSQ